jgi:hypothetical protein
MMPVMPFWAKFAHDGRSVNDEGNDNVANAPRIADEGNKVNYDSAANAANAATNARTDYNVSSPKGARAAMMAVLPTLSVFAMLPTISVLILMTGASNNASACSDCASVRVQYHIMFSKQATVFSCFPINCVCLFARLSSD